MEGGGGRFVFYLFIPFNDINIFVIKHILNHIGRCKITATQG